MSPTDKTSIRVSAVFFVLAVLLTYCTSPWAQSGFYVEIGAGKNDVFDENDWEGRESTGCYLGGGYLYAPSSRFVLDLNFSHYSQCTRGEGFDDRIEDALDAFYIKGRYFFK